MEIKAYEQQLAQHQENFLALLDSAGLPTQNIFVPTRERFTVFANAGALLERLDDESKRNAIYVSKFFAAVSAGLFDAALNYIWDETILHLRLRIDAYDLEYFYDIAASEIKSIFSAPRRSSSSVNFEISSNGRTPVFGAVYRGSSPCPPAMDGNLMNYPLLQVLNRVICT